jgi:hypothetical protein
MTIVGLRTESVVKSGSFCKAWNQGLHFKSSRLRQGTIEKSPWSVAQAEKATNGRLSRHNGCIILGKRWEGD